VGSKPANTGADIDWLKASLLLTERRGHKRPTLQHRGNRTKHDETNLFSCCLEVAPQTPGSSNGSEWYHWHS